MNMNRRGFLGRIAIGVAALHLRFGVQAALTAPARPQLLVAHWFQTTRGQHFAAPDYLAALSRQLPPNFDFKRDPARKAINP